MSDEYDFERTDKFASVRFSPEYLTYHAAVVEACVALAGEDTRHFWDKQCDYVEDYEAGTLPEEVAETNWDDIRR